MQTGSHYAQDPRPGSEGHAEPTVAPFLYCGQTPIHKDHARRVC